MVRLWLGWGWTGMLERMRRKEATRQRQHIAAVLIVGFFLWPQSEFPNNLLEEQLLRPPVTGVASAVRTRPEGVSVLTQVEQQIFTLINTIRRKAGKASVKEDAGLRLAARTHSIDMLDRGYFDHISPEGRTSSDRVAILHRQLVGVVGENIFRGSGMNSAEIYQLAKQIVTAWMERPGHRANILNDAYTHAGMGVAGKGKEIRATQVFAEAKAFLQNELSLQVRSHDRLNFLVVSGPQPERYDFWLPDRGIPAIPHRSVDETRVDIEPGTYRLRLYFPGASGYMIYNAPEVVVE